MVCGITHHVTRKIRKQASEIPGLEKLSMMNVAARGNSNPRSVCEYVHQLSN
jgi:hypothetical protein